MIYIASDHGGFQLKNKIILFLQAKGIQFEDLGPYEFDENDDYPDFASIAALKVSSAPNDNVAILVCRSGQGVNIAANKFKGVRSALVWNNKEAIASRTDDMANIISLPSDYIDADTAVDAVKIWLDTPWPTEGRHLRRVGKIMMIEEGNFK